MADTLDYTKEYKDLYQPAKKPALIQVPAMRFAWLDGTGAPEGPAYQNGVAALYAVAYTIKFSKMGPNKPAGYHEYKVPPLEGLWTDIPTLLPGDRDTWRFTSLIRQPEFVTEDVFRWAIDEAKRKKPEVDFAPLRFGTWEEGLCVQCMHIGPYATEPETLALMDAWMKENGYEPDFTDDTAGLSRRHHELYLGDPRKSKPENRKTVLRHPVRKAK